VTVSNFPATALEDNEYRFDIIDTGNGLGLAIGKKQLELMRTDLLLKSEFNKGSHFYFTLVLPLLKTK